MSIGPEWGNAHIEVHADTSPMRRELKAAAAAAGKEFGKEWGDAAETELGKELTVLGRHIETALKKQGRAGGTEWGEAFEDGVRRRLRRFDMNIIESALSGDWSFAIDQFGGLEQAIDGVNAKFSEMRKESDLSSEAFQDIEGSFLNWTRSVRNDNAFQALHDSALEMNVQWDRQKKEIADFDAALTQAFDDIEDAAHKMNAEFNKTSTAKAREEYNALHREAKALHFEITKMLKAHDEEDRTLQRVRDSAHDVALEYDRVARASKKARDDFSLFGRLKGSRNNFLNLVGSMSRAIEGFGDGIVKGFNPATLSHWVKGVGDAFAGFGDVFKVGRADGPMAGIKALTEQFTILGSAISGGKSGGIGGMIVGLAAGFLQIAQAITAVVFAIGTLNIIAPIITGLAGIITAIASSLSFAVAGFLLPLAPMALAVAAGVGAAIVAFKDAGDELEQVTKPFKDFFAELKKPVQDALFKNLAKDAERFKGVLNNFVGPLLIGAAGALSDAITYMVDAFNRPEVKSTLDILARTLPLILEDMGNALTDFVTGLLGFFAPISGFTVVIAEDIAKIAAKFSEWANSAEGQKSITDFFIQAWESAKLLWDIIVNVGDALSTLFSQGKETGDQFLGKIGEIIAEFATWANSEEGRAKIAGWMQFAKDLADRLWGAIQEVGRMIDQLDTPANREALLALIDAFGAITRAVGDVAKAVAPLAPAFTVAFRVVGALATSAADLIGDVSNAVQNLIKWLGRITVPSALGAIGSAMKAITGKVMSFPGMATGGITSGPTIAGEAGREMVIPLERPLNMVDPSVRWLSAMLQGKGGSMAGQGGGAPSRSIIVADGAIRFSAAVRDPELVTNMVLDRLVSQIA